MSHIPWYILAALFGMSCSVGVGQEANSPDVTGPEILRIPYAAPTAVSPNASGSELDARPADELAVPAGMTLVELEEIALRCNPTLVQSANRVNAARGRWEQAGLYPNPEAGYLGGEIGNEGRGGQQGGYLGQEIVTAGKLQLAQSVAEQQVQQAKWARETQRQRVLTDVRRSFYEVLVAQRFLEITEQLLRIGEEGVRSSESLLTAKEVARGDVLQARIEAESARVLLEKARNRHAAAWRGLTAVTGMGDVSPAPLIGEAWEDLPVLSWEETYSRLLEESPRLAFARAGVARAEAAVQRECAQRTPNIDLQAMVQFDHATEDTIATVQAGMPLPVFNRNQGNIRKAQAEFAAAKNEIQRVQLDLQQQLSTFFERYMTALYQVEKYSREIVPSAQESLDLANNGYQRGEYNYLFLLTAQRTYFQTNLTYLDSLRELRTAATAIDGNLLSGSLQATDDTERE